MGRKRSRNPTRPYSTGELNRSIDALLHPLAKLDPSFLILDGILHGLVERNPSESFVKFIRHNLPRLVAEYMRSRR